MKRGTIPMILWQVIVIILLTSVVLIFLCQFLFRKWQAWRMQQRLDHRKAEASVSRQRVTKQVLTKKIEESKRERFKRGFAFRGNFDLYIGYGILIGVAIVLMLVTVHRGFQKSEGLNVIPWKDVCIATIALLLTASGVVFCRFLMRKWEEWRTQNFLQRRAATTVPGVQGFTAYDKQLLTQERERSRIEQWKKSFAFRGNSDLYAAFGLFILAVLLLVVLALGNQFHKDGVPY